MGRGHPPHQRSIASVHRIRLAIQWQRATFTGGGFGQVSTMLSERTPRLSLSEACPNLLVGADCNRAESDSRFRHGRTKRSQMTGIQKIAGLRSEMASISKPKDMPQGRTPSKAI